MTISICMIVKNEAELLPRCLGNLDGFWEELIVVDTGSEDETISVAEKYGATVLHYDWRYPGHKGEARNVGVDAAKSDWVIVLDADEVIRQPVELRAWLETLPGEYTGALVTFENYTEDGSVSLRWMQQRIWRNGCYRYIHREHEYPQRIEGKANSEVGSTFVFSHLPPPERAAPKVGAMLDRLIADVEERPNDTHSLYFLHRQYRHAGMWRESLAMGERYLTMGAGMRTACYGNMSACEMELGNMNAAIEWLHRALSEEPQRRYWWIRIADLHMTQGAWNTALAYLRGAAEVWQQHYMETEPEYEEHGLMALTTKCQKALAAGYHTH